MKVYFSRIYDARYFWMHLVRIDLKNKFRRSKLGFLWAFVSPLCLTCIMAIVFAVAFQSNITDYAPYILSGLLFWDVVNNSVQAGATSIIANGAYIQQFNHPITIYTLKSALVNVITFLIAIIALAVWILFVQPINLILSLLSLPLTVVMYFGLAWPITTIASYINTKYRDYPQLAALFMQTLWYLSPVFFKEDMFSKIDILHIWFNINPVTHFLYLVREPFINGQLPSWYSYVYCFFFIVLLSVLAIKCDKNNRQDVIFYI